MKDIVPLAVVIWLFASWITHIVICIKSASYLFLIVGAILMPVAWIHGTGAWFGAW